MIISTVWEIVTYDVWGNKRDGFEVNQAFRSGKVEMPVRLKLYNMLYSVNSPEVTFYDGSPDDTDIRKALGITPRVRFYDPYHNPGVIYANHVSTDYPLGELRLVSHDGLSFNPDKIIMGYKWIKTDGKLYPVFKQANGDDFMEEDFCLELTAGYNYTKAEIIRCVTNKLKSQGYAIPRRHLELDPNDF